jgi:hypothetical protein
MEMANNDYLTFIVEYRTKLSRLLYLLNQNPIKYRDRILETNAMIKVVDYLKDEYMKSVYSNLQDTTILPEIGARWTRNDLS